MRPDRARDLRREVQRKLGAGLASRCEIASEDGEPITRQARERDWRREVRPRARMEIRAVAGLRSDRKVSK